jgi:ribose-phosphate pyrophosphokinase
MESESVVSVETTIPLFASSGMVSRPVTRESPATWVERMPNKRLMLFSGRSNPELGERIAEQLGVNLAEVTLKTFTNGEVYARYEESIRGADVFIVQSCSTPSPNDSLMELLIMVQAARLASAKRVTAVMPWYPYVRQDKKGMPREPITAKLVADMLESAGVDRVLTMDLHAGQVQGFFTNPVDHMTAVPMLADHFKDLIAADPDDIVVVAGDAGRTKLAKKFSEMLGAGLAIISKDRPEQQVAVVTDVIGRVGGKICIVIDDMIDTAGTLCAGGEALAELGATEVYACATHAVFSGPANERLESSVFKQVVVTDTIPVDPIKRPENVRVLSVAPILADTISNVFNDDSVSELFHGGNQLF